MLNQDFVPALISSVVTVSNSGVECSALPQTRAHSRGRALFLVETRSNVLRSGSKTMGYSPEWRNSRDMNRRLGDERYWSHSCGETGHSANLVAISLGLRQRAIRPSDECVFSRRDA